jgi:hypothetical protein
MSFFIEVPSDIGIMNVKDCYITIPYRIETADTTQFNKPLSFKDVVKGFDVCINGKVVESQDFEIDEMIRQHRRKNDTWNWDEEFINLNNYNKKRNKRKNKN